MSRVVVSYYYNFQVNKMVSNVWNFFKKVPNENYVTCNVCNKRLTHNSSSTGAMHNHLKLKHPTIKLENEESDSRLRQQTVSQMFMNRKCSDNKSSKITELIREVLVHNLLPFSLVESESFQNLINYLEPGYKIPSRVIFRLKFKRNMKIKRKS